MNTTYNAGDTSPVTGELSKTTINPRPATATRCAICVNEHAEFDDDGYCLCCRSYWEIDPVTGCYQSKPRTVKEICEAFGESWDEARWIECQLWRHEIEYGMEKLTPEQIPIMERLKADAAEIEKKYCMDNSDWTNHFEFGLLNGRISALSWVYGMSWDELPDIHQLTKLRTLGAMEMFDTRSRVERTRKEIGRAWRGFWDIVWLYRNQTIPEMKAVTPEAIEWMKAKTAEFEKKYGKENLICNAYQHGLATGNLSALDWTLGTDWDMSMET